MKTAATRRVVTPVHLVQLMSAIGPTRAADRLGVSTTMIHKARKENEVNSVVETAASHILEHLGEPAKSAVRVRLPASASAPAAKSTELLLLSAPVDKVEIITKVAAAIGAQVLH